jgi:hypothetical protein
MPAPAGRTNRPVPGNCTDSACLQRSATQQIKAWKEEPQHCAATHCCAATHTSAHITNIRCHTGCLQLLRMLAPAALLLRMCTSCAAAVCCHYASDQRAVKPAYHATNSRVAALHNARAFQELHTTIGLAAAPARACRGGK